nr:putative nucleotidyltransferase, ribonuclease H [Tanacetum cinerariifolium]
TIQTLLYGRICRAPICWDQVGEHVIEGPEIIEVTNAKVAVAKEKLKKTRTRQKSYVDKHRRSLEFQPGTFVARCLICQQVKIEHQRASDRLTKSAHFLPVRKDYSVSRLAEIFQQEIVRLHGTPSTIVSDRDPRFASHFWKGLQKAWGTRLKFSIAFHPQTDGQSERTIQTLEDMLRSCALEWTGNWDDYICLVEFAYNNSWHASIKCAPFEMLYGPEMIEVTNAKVDVAKEKLKEARTHQKSYADKHRRSLEFQP